MEQFDSVTPDIGAPDANNPFGTFLDEDAGIPGTPILAGWKTTIKAFFERFKTETNTTFNGNPDSAVVSQAFDMFMQLVSGLDPAVAEWAAATFNQDDVTKYRGIQWFVGLASTINTPGPLSEWVASPTLREAMRWATFDGPLKGGFSQLTNIRDLTNYATYFRMGKYDWHGNKFEAWWINIDGSAHVSGTSDVAKLLAASKFESEVVASDTAGTLTLKDYLGKISRAVDAVAGFTQDVGDEQEDQGQGHEHAINHDHGSFNTASGGNHTHGLQTNHDSTAAASDQSVTASDGLIGTYITPSGGPHIHNINVPAIVDDSGNPKTDGVNGTPRTGEKTRDRSYGEGATGLVCLVPAGTI